MTFKWIKIYIRVNYTGIFTNVSADISIRSEMYVTKLINPDSRVSERNSRLIYLEEIVI